MLIEFSIGNYRSFREPVTLSMMATPLRDDSRLDADSIFQVGKLSLLRSAAIYGANASGKSNLVRALATMRNLVLNSATKIQAGEKLPIAPFRLDVSTRQQPAYFQIIFFLNGRRYRYGFEADEEKIYSEWLYHAAQRETRLFVREGQIFDIANTFRREATSSLQRQTRANALFLSVLAQFNSKTASELLNWFRLHLRFISGLNDDAYAGYTMDRLENDDNFRRRVQEVIRLADTGILDISVQTLPADHPGLSDELRLMLKNLASQKNKPESEFSVKNIQVKHALFDGSQRVDETFFDIRDESEGTQKFLALLGPLFDVLENGWTLFVDELEARLHPLLTREIVRLFNTRTTNPKNAQLIFATHDAGLLGECLLRRDQIWFTQKNRYGATELYSLAEMKERKDASYLKNYLTGRYGGIPLLGGLRPYVEQEFEYGAQS